AAIASGEGIRRRLTDPTCPLDFPVLKDFREQGLTDYLLTPLLFSNGEVHVATWATRAAAGFSAAAVAASDAVAPALARIAEIRALHRIAGTLLDTYVGQRSGERILAGQIRRGPTETIAAAVWLSDLRGF